MAFRGDSDFEDEDTFDEAMEPVETLQIPETCKRHVIVGRRKKLCDDKSNSLCGFCSNHCQYANCENHGHYPVRR